MIISTFLTSLCVHQINGEFSFQSQPYFMQQYPEEYEVYVEDPGPYREEVEVTYATVEIENLRGEIAALQTQMYSLAATVRTQNEQIKSLIHSEDVVVSRIPICDWVLEEDPLFDYEQDDAWDDTLTFFNDLNITYALWNGAALGALRNRGKIPLDGDIDLIIPIYLNFWTDECMEAVSARPYPPNTEAYCGGNRDYWTDVVREWLQSVVNEQPELSQDRHISISRRSFGGFRFSGFGVGVDVIVSIEDHKFNQDTHPVCRCPMGDTVWSFCFESQHKEMRAYYGDDYLVPDRGNF